MVLLDGLEEGRWVIAAKVHHSLVDGISGASVTNLILDFEPQPDPNARGVLEAAPPADNETGIHGPISLMTEGARAGLDLALHPRKLGSMLSRSRGVAEVLVRDELRGAPATSLNVQIGATRRMAAVPASLEDLKAVKRALGGTVNDVVLAASAGGLRRLLELRGEEPDPRGMRAMVPVSLRDASEALALGNRVSSLFVELPVGEADPARALPAHRRGGGGAQGKPPGGWGGDGPRSRRGRPAGDPRGAGEARLHAAAVQHHDHERARPAAPLYALGAQLRRIIPLVPIFAFHAVGIAVVSYNGEIVFGLSADRGSVPDLDVLATGIKESLAELFELARIS